MFWNLTLALELFVLKCFGGQLLYDSFLRNSDILKDVFVAVLYSGTFCFLRSGIRKSVQWYNGMSIVYNLELNFNQNRLLKVMRCENLENFTIFYHY
jgi:hypothetical protein